MLLERLTVGALLALLVRDELRHRCTTRLRQRVLCLCQGWHFEEGVRIEPEVAIDQAWQSFRLGEFDIVCEGRRLTSLDDELDYGPNTDLVLLPKVAVRPR